MTEPIPGHLIQRAHRQLIRRIAACCIRTMADTDFDLSSIAKRIGKSEDHIRGWLYGLIDGGANSTDMDSFSDFLLAMGCEPEITVQPCSFLNETKPTENAAVSS